MNTNLLHISNTDASLRTIWVGVPTNEDADEEGMVVLRNIVIFDGFGEEIGRHPRGQAYAQQETDEESRRHLAADWCEAMGTTHLQIERDRLAAKLADIDALLDTVAKVWG